MGGTTIMPHLLKVVGQKDGIHVLQLDKGCVKVVQHFLGGPFACVNIIGIDYLWVEDS
jgi:hypothetical protein